MTSANSGAAKTVTIPDPRPETVQREGRHFIRGMICTACGHPTVVRTPWCPRCQSDMVEKLYGPTGAVWSATVVHIRVPNQQSPYALAYVDLDNGPRVLAHVDQADRRLAVGQTVRLVEATDDGDVQVTAS